MASDLGCDSGCDFLSDFEFDFAIFATTIAVAAVATVATVAIVAIVFIEGLPDTADFDPSIAPDFAPTFATEAVPFAAVTEAFGAVALRAPEAGAADAALGEPLAELFAALAPDLPLAFAAGAVFFRFDFFAVFAFAIFFLEMFHRPNRR